MPAFVLCGFPVKNETLTSFTLPVFPELRLSLLNFCVATAI
uniref:Uncharacterized protein n=1 Tax=Anguilla anguilla TaxID=7936 RepID=A0A0E9WKC7_ANGAN